LASARFSRVDDARDNEAAKPLKSARSSSAIGYFIWQPFSPGSLVMRDMIAPLLLTLALMAGMVWFLLGRIRRSTAALKASEAQSKHLAFHDVLTGLPNRALLDDRLDRALAAARRFPEQQCALLCLDLDRFKAVNDTLGHPAGDCLLRDVAARLSAAVRETDSVARMGGDEFAIIQAGRPSKEDVEALCKRLVDSLGQPFNIMGTQVFVGISIGVARSGIDGYDRAELARRGDIALYHAKAEGRGRYDCIQIRQGLERDLRAALDAGDQLRVYYQPLYDLACQTVLGLEALVRWQHPTHGLMLPVTFIAMAEETGLIARLGDWVLEQACREGVRWPIGTMAVNVSAVQLRNPQFVQNVLDILQTTGFDPSRLELEITETAFLESFGQHESNVRRLRAAGIRIALDDFGTGYSSLSHLRKFNVDRIKIDRSFVAGIGGQSGSSEIIAAIIGLARSLGLQTTAEGVETAEQRQFLFTAGCDTMQGFLLSPALPPHQIPRVLGITGPGRTRPPLAA
jgi:diguanylate cyclase (GGDEF)-like protein